MKRCLLLLALVLAASAALAQTYNPYGYYTQVSTYSTTVQPPINANGSSVWPAKKAGVVPVKFTLSVGTGDLTIISATDGNAAHAYGRVEFTIPAGLTLNNMAALSYIGTTVGCGAGSPRFVLDYGGVYMSIYLGGYTSPGDPNSGCADYVGTNLLGDATATRFEATQLGNATMYDTWPNIKALYGDQTIQGMWLVTDNGNSSVTLTSVNVQSTTYTFAGAASPTCDLPTAYIVLSQTPSNYTPAISEDTFIMAPDTDSMFRVSDCQYIYNLNTKNLQPGHYYVAAKIGTQVLDVGGQFSLK